VAELVSDRIEAVVAPPLSYGPGVDAVGSPQMGSLELGYKEFLPHAQSVLAGLVKMGFMNIFVVCHHQGEYGQQALCMKLAAANLGLEVPNATHPHWWGVLSPSDERPRAPSIQIVTTTIGLQNMADTSLMQYNFVGHGGYYETAAILGLFPHAVDLAELASGRPDLPWFGQPEYGDGPDGGSAADATTEFGTRMVDAWAASLAAEVLKRSGAILDAAAEAALFRGSAEPPPGRRVHCPTSKQLDQMRPAEIQAAAAAGVPVLLPIGVLENHGYHLPCGVDLVSARAVAELASQLTEAVVAPPLSYGPGVDAVGSPQMGSLELGYKEFLPHAQSVLAGLVKMGFMNIFGVCQHQGAGGQLWLAFELAGSHLWIETPNKAYPHWWGTLPPPEQPPAPTIAVLSTIPGADYTEEKYIGGDHAGFWETSGILGCCEQACDLAELKRPDTPWFAAGKPWHRDTIPAGGAEWGREMIHNWSRGLADEIDVRTGRRSLADIQTERGAERATTAPRVSASAKL
jgi:creatinine amidohydrolase